MITNQTKLQELVEELAELSLTDRRQYIAQIEVADGPAAAEQIKAALLAHWRDK